MFSFYFLLLQVSNPVPLAIQPTHQSASVSEANAVSETKPSISDDKSLNNTESVLTNQEPTVVLGECFSFYARVRSKNFAQCFHEFFLKKIVIFNLQSL